METLTNTISKLESTDSISDTPQPFSKMIQAVLEAAPKVEQELFDAYGYPSNDAAHLIAGSTGLSEADVYCTLKLVKRHNLLDPFGLPDDKAIAEFHSPSSQTSSSFGVSSLADTLLAMGGGKKKEPLDLDNMPDAPRPARARLDGTLQYPEEAWRGTIYEEFAEACGKGNVIPREFFIESLKSVVGAVCGHRITFENGKQSGRFYTVLIGPAGTGKTTAATWAVNALLGTGLVYNTDGPPKFRNIGCFADGGFGSSVGLIEAFCDHPRILQFYDELAVPIEKFAIAGSGRGFMGMLCALYESTLPPSHRIKKTKHTPAEAYASMLGCSTPEKWEAMFSKTGAEESGFFQRLNLIASENTDTVPMIREPELDAVRQKLIAKIEPLENQVVEIVTTPEADKVFSDWHEDLAARTGQDSTDVTGRLNVLVQRNALHLAWLLAPPASGSELNAVAGGLGVRQTLRSTLDADIMQRAIRLADWELEIRRQYRPVIGNNDWAVVENLIKKNMQKYKAISRSALYHCIHGERYGLKMFSQSIVNLAEEGLLTVAKEGVGRKKEILRWVG
jgi:hypothetical protein